MVASGEPLCPHRTLHGPTSAGTWICNRCGMEIIEERSGGIGFQLIPPKFLLGDR